MRRRALRRAAALALVLALVLAAPAAPAWADGDPASDVLLAQDTFLPYPPSDVSPPVRRALTTTVARAKAKGFGVKVAIITSERDLGSVGNLLGNPQGYADLLTQELSLNVRHGRDAVGAPRVLVVLPGGLGGNNLGDGAGTALDGLQPVADEGPDGLARTAATAVGRLAAADGKAFAVPALPRARGTSGGSGGAGAGMPAAVVFGAPVLLVALVAAALAVRGRSAPTAAEPTDTEHGSG